LNLPKHQIRVDDEPILSRTVRLLNENGVEDIFIVGSDKSYYVKESKLFIPVLNVENLGADKFLSSAELWNLKGRTITLFGDVFFSEAGIRKIVNDDSTTWMVYGRPYKSSYTKKKYGEIFANSFYSSNIKQFKTNLFYIADLCKRKIIKRCIAWEHYRAMSGARGKQLEKHIVYKNFTVIDDYTDDFDYPKDYDTFLERWKTRNQISQFVYRKVLSFYFRNRFFFLNVLRKVYLYVLNPN